MKISQRDRLNLELQNEVGASSSLKNILALDYGTKFCGLAFSPDGAVVLPLMVFETENFEAEMAGVLNHRSIDLLVVGLPTSISGQKNQLCFTIQKVVKSWAEKHQLKFDWVNEQFSSRGVLAKGDKRIDDLAAVKILEFYLAKKR